MKYSILILFPALFFWLLTQPQSLTSDVDLLISDSTSQEVFLFAGFVGCADICPKHLGQMSQVIDKVKDPKVSFYFLNLASDHDESAEAYGVNFHKSFKTLKSTEASALIKRFNLNPNNSTNAPNHPPTWYHLVKSGNSWQLKHTYNDPKNASALESWVFKTIEETT